MSTLVDVRMRCARASIIPLPSSPFQARGSECSVAMATQRRDPGVGARSEAEDGRASRSDTVSVNWRLVRGIQNTVRGCRSACPAAGSSVYSSRAAPATLIRYQLRRPMRHRRVILAGAVRGMGMCMHVPPSPGSVGLGDCRGCGIGGDANRRRQAWAIGVPHSSTSCVCSMSNARSQYMCAAQCQCGVPRYAAWRGHTCTYAFAASRSHVWEQVFIDTAITVTRD
ncbi:hypothetical protein JB92DRAFT_1378747 [Gautieria morchelliformis]|nr:hypothetical protein JB92DRAFT_1378747 [Gautieria morchelliformis]